MKVTAVVAGLLMFAAIGSSAVTPAAEAKVRCKPWGQTYDIGSKYYFVGGLRCSKAIRKIVVDGFVRVKGDGIGENPLFQFNATCKKKRVCLAQTPDYRNYRGRQTMTVVFATRFLEDWNSLATYSAGFKRTYTR